MDNYHKDLLNGLYGDNAWKKYYQNDIDVIHQVYMKTNNVPSVGRETAERSYHMYCDIRNRIKNVKFNPPATIVFWTDSTMTVVKCENEDYDPEKGLAMCICKKMLGNKGSYYNVFRKWLPKEDDSDPDQNLLRSIKPMTFKFDLKPIDINKNLFEVLTGALGGTTIQFETKKTEENE